MFTHKPVRNGSVVSISIYGDRGSKFARRIAEDALKAGERLGDNVDIVTVGDRQNFLFAVEQLPPAAPSPRTVPKRVRRRARLLAPIPRGLAARPRLRLGQGQPS